jgi:hypothetical protein
MSLSKVNFAGRSLEVFTAIDEKGEKWYQANPFADALGYSKCNKALLQNVSAGNMSNYKELCHGNTDDSSVLPPSIQAKTKFINKGGMIELLINSQMDYARQFRYWLSSVKLNTGVDMDAIAEFDVWRTDAANATLLNSLVDHKDKVNGVVYVITNRLLQMIDAYKIGFTHDLDARLNELNVASPLDFKAVFVRQTTNPRELENKLHDHFRQFRIKREFFKLNKEDIALLPLICNQLLSATTYQTAPSFNM